VQILPPLVGLVPEARLNLVLLYCRRGDPARALGLLRGMEPATAFEHICQVLEAAAVGVVAGPCLGLKYRATFSTHNIIHSPYGST